MIGWARAGPESTYLADRGGVAGLTGELCGQCPVPRHECACASRGGATGKNRKATGRNKEGAYSLQDNKDELLAMARHYAC